MSHRLYTWSWRPALDSADDSVVLVRTSLGKPKWVSRALADAIPYIPELAPKGMFHVRDEQRFRQLYRDRLDGFGAGRIERRFRTLIDANGGRPLILLCFERRAADCHRSMFAEWWQERTGEEVPEWEPPSTPARAAREPEPAGQVEQSGLF